jgi:hypothetical protein
MLSSIDNISLNIISERVSEYYSFKFVDDKLYFCHKMIMHETCSDSTLNELNA